MFQFYEHWQTSPMRAMENLFDNAHFSFVHYTTCGVAAGLKSSQYNIVETTQALL